MKPFVRLSTGPYGGRLKASLYTCVCSTVLRVVLLFETGELKEYKSFKNTFSKVVDTNPVYRLNINDQRRRI